MVDKTIRVGPLPPDDKYIEMEISYRSIIPDLDVGTQIEISYDFVSSIAGFLGLPEDKWCAKEFGISRYVPLSILFEFYDGALMYYASRVGKLDEAFGALAADRIVLKSVSALPELMVKYRFYQGIANDDGEYKLITGNGDDLELIGIQDPYHRLFYLDTRKNRQSFVNTYGKTSVTLKGKEDLLIFDNQGRSKRALTFRKCLNRIINDESDPIRKFIEDIYSNVRIPEYHGIRLGDNVLFELDKYIRNLVITMNYLFTNDLDLPYKRKKREPFRIRVFRLAVSHKISEQKNIVGYEDFCILTKGSKKYP